MGFPLLRVACTHHNAGQKAANAKLDGPGAATELALVRMLGACIPSRFFSFLFFYVNIHVKRRRACPVQCTNFNDNSSNTAKTATHINNGTVNNEQINAPPRGRLRIYPFHGPLQDEPPWCSRKSLVVQMEKTNRNTPSPKDTANGTIRR